jgi:hypothetical protein
MSSRRWAREDGQALVLALGMIVVTLLIGFATLAYAMEANTLTSHDQRLRRAQQGADAGIQQALYTNADVTDDGYNFTGGTLGLSALLDCTVPEVSAGVAIGTVSVEADSAGVCPSECASVSAGVCAPPSPLTWLAVGNEDYFQSEFLPNAVGREGCSASAANCDPVLWPEIVAEGCDTTATGAAASTACDSSSSGAHWSREMVELSPSQQLPMLDAVNQVALNNEIPNLAATYGLSAILPTGGLPAPTIASLVCSLLSSLKLQACDVLQSIYSTVSYGGDTTNNSVPPGLAVVDGDIQAGVKILAPDDTIALNSSSNSLVSSLQQLIGNVLSLQSPLASGGSLAATWTLGQGGNVCTWAQPLIYSESAYAGNCGPTGSTASTGACVGSYANGSGCVPPDHGLDGVHFVMDNAGVCSVSTPISQRGDCLMQPSGFSISAATFAGTQCSGSAATSTDCVVYGGGAGASDYADGDLTLSSGSVQFAPGTYVLCGLYATGSATVSDSARGGVQIYVLSPEQCTTNPAVPSGLAPGDFIAVNGVDNLLTGVVNASTSATTLLDPTGFQIYLAGDPTENMQPSLNAGAAGGGTVPVNGSSGYDAQYPAVCTSNYGINTTKATPAGGSCADNPDTGVYIGDPSASLSGALTGAGESTADPDEALFVYAPQSEVTLNTSLAFEGNLIGFNVDITALAVLQDLEVGSDPLSSVAADTKVVATLQCTPTPGGLTGTVADTYGCG